MNKKIYQLVSVFAVFILVFGNSISVDAASTYGAPMLQSQVVAIPAFPVAEGFGANINDSSSGNIISGNTRPMKYYGVDRGSPFTDANYANLAQHAVKTIIVDTFIDDVSNSSSAKWSNIKALAAKYNFNYVIWPNQGGDVSGCGWETPFNSPQSGDYIWRVKTMLDSFATDSHFIGMISAHEPMWNTSTCKTSISDMASIKTQLKNYMQTKGRTDFKVWNYIDNVSDLKNMSGYTSADIERVMDVAVTWQHCFGGAEGTCSGAKNKIIADRALINNAGLDGKVELVYLFQTFATGGGYTMPTLVDMQTWDCQFIATNALDGFMYYTWGAWYSTDLSNHPELWPEMNRVYDSCINQTGTTPTPTPTIAPDTTAPVVVSSVRANANPTNAASVDFIYTFSESVTSLDAGDFTLTKTGTSIMGISGSGSVYTVSVNSGTSDGALRLDVSASATITDLAGNPLAGLPYTSGESYTIDKTAPIVVSSTRVNIYPTNAASVDFIFTFSKGVTGVDIADFSLTTNGVSGATVSGISGSGSVYTVSVNTGTESGDLRLDVSASATITDLTGNLLAGLPYTSGESYTIDKTAPVLISSVRVIANPTFAASVDFTVSFSEPVSGVDVGDFALFKTGMIAGESITSVNGGPNIYTVSVNTGTESGDLRLDVPASATITDLAGNLLAGLPYASGESYIIDRTIPTLILSARVNVNPTSAVSVDFTVSFSEPVTGVDVGDFALSKTGAITGELVTGVNGGASVYTVSVNTGTGDGTLRLDLVDNDSIVDVTPTPLGGAGLGNGNFTLGETYTIDKNAPLVVSSLRSDSNPSTAESIHFAVTFTEAVSGVDASDFMLTTTDGLSGASITGLSGSANAYSIAVATGSNNGTLRLDLIDNDSIVDSVNQPLGGLGAGNGNFTTGEIYTVNKSPIGTVNIVSETFRSNGTNDGWVLESSEDSNTGGSKNSKADTFNLGDDAKDRQYRSILHFPTNHLPDKAVVTQVILTFKSKGVVGTDPFATHQNISVDIRKGVFNNSSFFNFGSLQLQSFQAPADMVSAATIQNNPVDGWYWAMLDSKALAYINLTGATQIRLGFQLDDNDDMGDDYIKFYSGNYGSQKYRPQLQVQYYVPK